MSDPTIYDVARAAGVSKSLVSLVLRGSSGVSTKRREAVERAIAELGYRPNLAAASLAGNSTGSIGVVVDDYTNLWFVNLVRGLEAALESSAGRQTVTVSDIHLNARLGGSPVDGYLAMRVDGLVIAAEPTPEIVAALGLPAASRAPVVVAGGRDGVVPGADTVAIDEEAGSALAINHLVTLGHRRIAHLSGVGGSARHRRAGYLAAASEHGLDPIVVGESTPTDERSGYHAALAALDAHPSLSAIFAANDTMALGALAAIRDRGLSVPGDVSVVGYDNSPLADAHLLSLTTVDDRGAEVGNEVASLLLSRMKDPALPPRHHLVPPVLVERSSAGPVRP